MNRFLLFLFAISSNYLYGQNSSRIASILRMERTQIVKLNQEEGNTVTYLPSEFAEDVLTADKYTYLHEATILKVYYVYTQYRLSPAFDQLTLDNKRFRLLNEYFPEILADPLIEWQILEQTGCKHFSEGDSYFHGFVIIHRPLPDSDDYENELKLINAFIDNPTATFTAPDEDLVKKQIESSGESPETDTTSNITTDSPAKYPDGEYALYKYFKNEMDNCEEVSSKRKDIWVNVSFTVDEKGKIEDIKFDGNYSDNIINQVAGTLEEMPDWDPATKGGKPESSEVNLQIRVSYSPHVKGMYTRDGHKPTFSDEKLPVELPKETGEVNTMFTTEKITIKTTSVYKGLDLVMEKKNLALVMDVTGSMSGNIAGMVFWINAHNQSEIPFTSYTFFNDGDNKPTRKKEIGETGGIYFTKSINAMSQTLKDAIMKGNGGERPENDIEAILHALENDPDTDGILLVGDNYSEVRDLSLLPNVLKPVHVLLCTAPRAVRPDYLQIAQATGGLFIINGEVIDLSNVLKGEKIIIQGVEYKFNGREFKNLTGDENY